jgi:hypothetical protein
MLFLVFFIADGTEMRVMNGGMVGFVDPHDPTGVRQALGFSSIITLLQLFMRPSPQILFQREWSPMRIALRAKTSPLPTVSLCLFYCIFPRTGFISNSFSCSRNSQVFC